MTKTFYYHMVEMTIRPYENDKYLLSARIKRKWVEVLTSDSTIYQYAPASFNELKEDNNKITNHYAKNLISNAKKKAFNLLSLQCKKQ